MHVGRLGVRTVIGSLFIGHGTQKLFGWFDGPGPAGTEAMMESLRLRPVRRNAIAAGATEATGGLMLLAGLATPAAAAGLIGVMSTAIRTVHLPKGVWNSGGGYEYNLTLIAAMLALVETGPGDLSLDHLLKLEKRGPAWALAALAVGLAASTAVVTLGRRTAQTAQTAQT